MSQTTTRFTHPHPLAWWQQKPAGISGIRLDTPVATTRGLGEDEFLTVVRLTRRARFRRSERRRACIDRCARARAEVIQLCERFPIYCRLTPTMTSAPI